MKPIMIKLYIDDFKDKQTWIDVCKTFGVFVDNDLKCSNTSYEVQEIKFKALDIKGC